MKTYYYTNRDVLGLKAGTVLEETAGGRIKLDVGFGGIPCFVPHDLPPEISKIALADPVLGYDWELDEGDQPRLWKEGDVYCDYASGIVLPGPPPDRDEHGLAIRYILRRKAKPEPEDDGFVRYPITSHGGDWVYPSPPDEILLPIIHAFSLVGFNHIETEKGEERSCMHPFRPDDPPKCVVCRKGEG